MTTGSSPTPPPPPGKPRPPERLSLSACGPLPAEDGHAAIYTSGLLNGLMGQMGLAMGAYTVEAVSVSHPDAGRVIVTVVARRALPWPKALGPSKS